MACYRPVHIKNNTLCYCENQPAFLNVPCGKCEACFESRRFAWFSRSYAEWYAHPSWHKVCYTLTFDDAHLPRQFGLKCFDLSIFQNFIKRLRSRLGGVEFSYLCVSEYGELFARPHHHVLFFFEPKITRKDFYLAVLFSWQQGYIHVRPHTSYGSIEGVKALKYCTKYVTKDLDFHMRNFRFRSLRYFAVLYKNSFIDVPFQSVERVPRSVKRLKQYLKEFKHDYRSKDDSIYIFCLAARRFISRHSPFCTSSNGFGSAVVDRLTSYELENAVIKLPTSEGFKAFAMPSYLKRKFYYDRIENPLTGKRDLYRINDFGLKVFENRFNLQVQTLADKLRNLSKSFRFISTLSSSYNDLLPFNLSASLNYINNIDSYENFAKYRLLYRYTTIDLSQKEDVFSDSSCRSFFRQMLCERHISADFGLHPLSSFAISSAKNIILRNHLTFSDYETCCIIYDVLTSYISKITSDVKVDKRAKERHAAQVEKLRMYIYNKRLKYEAV